MLTALVLLALSAPADPPKDKSKELPAEAKKELKKLEGKWQLVKAVFKEGEDDLKGLDVFGTFDGDQMLLFPGKKQETYRVTAIDVTTNPKCIDFQVRRKDGAERLVEGVYKIDGDTFQFAFSAPEDGKMRPTSLAKPTDSRTQVWLFKRVKE
jgi:uncharacterized protein (TIGR03067 family)